MGLAERHTATYHTRTLHRQPRTHVHEEQVCSSSAPGNQCEITAAHRIQVSTAIDSMSDPFAVHADRTCGSPPGGVACPCFIGFISLVSCFIWIYGASMVGYRYRTDIVSFVLRSGSSMDLRVFTDWMMALTGSAPLPDLHRLPQPLLLSSPAPSGPNWSPAVQGTQMVFSTEVQR
jgi:hypothetical protein